MELGGLYDLIMLREVKEAIVQPACLLVVITCGSLLILHLNRTAATRLTSAALGLLQNIIAFGKHY